MSHETVNDNKDCTACRLCEWICPCKAIYFEKDSEGFLYPKVNYKKCVYCGLCVAKCPEYGDNNLKRATISAYVAVHKKESILSLSSSGGAFPAIAKAILDNGGYVLGTMLDCKKWIAHVICISDISELPKLQGSKYIQSDMDGIFEVINQKLSTGKYVLFTGTPCQIAGVRNAFDSYSNLITIDLVCHGIPSPKTFQEYIKTLEIKYGDIVDYRFRSKKFGWKIACEFTDQKNKKHTILGRCDSYSSLYHHCYYLRECCYNCKYACSERVGDLTLCDYWGIERYHPEINCNMGASAILCNTFKGDFVWQLAKQELQCIKTEFDWVVDGNGSLQHPVRRPTQRDAISTAIAELGFEKMAQKYCKLSPQIYNSVLNILPEKIIIWLGDLKRKINKIKRRF